MTKTKLQIMREKKGLTNIDLLKVFSEHPESYDPYDIDDLTLAFNTLTIFTLCELGLAEAKKEMLDLFAQALGCSVDELVEN